MATREEGQNQGGMIVANDRYTDEKLLAEYGVRPQGNGLFSPKEMGYRCPKGHSNIDWSEFNEHIWCYECKKDYHYAKDCVMIDDEYNPKDLDEWPRLVCGVTNYSEDGETFNDIPEELLVRKKYPSVCQSCGGELEETDHEVMPNLGEVAVYAKCQRCGKKWEMLFDRPYIEEVVENQGG